MKRRTFFLSVTLAMILQINSGKISSQNVAITNDATFTTPQSILHLYRNADGSLLQLSNPTTTAGVNRGLYFTATLNDFSLINNEAGSLSFHTSNTQRAIILSTGQFGINMTPVMMLDVTSASTTAGDAAIRGASTGNAAVYGVQGTISSTTLNAAGVYGYASGNAQVFGVYGSLPASNITANASGVRGYVPASAGNVYGVFGESAATGASSAGIRGLTTGNNGTGVYAQAQGAGTSYAFRGTATGAGTTNYAAYLSASGATTNYGLFVNAGGVRFVPLASGANGAVLRTNNTGDLVITNFSGSAGDVLLGTGAFGPATTSGTAWQLAGNTLVGTEFIGSTNAQPFIIRTNNTERARVLSGGNILFNRTTALYATDMFEVQGDATFPDVISAYTSDASGIGVWGQNTFVSGGGSGAGGYFTSNQTGNSALGAGLQSTSSFSGTAVSGIAASTVPNGIGVIGGCDNAAGTGVWGQSTGGGGTGVVGIASSSTGTGAYFANVAANGTNTGFGLDVRSNQTGGSALMVNLRSSSYFSNAAVSAITINTVAGGIGVIGACDNATGRGIQGQAAGSSGYGVYGIAGGTIAGAGIFGGHTAGVSGTGFTIANCRGAIKGQGAVAGNYGFGVIGSGGTSTRSGGVLGDDYNLVRGALGYYASSGSDYGVYAFGSYLLGVGGGKSTNYQLEANSYIGIGVYGGVMGGWIRGLKYGTLVKGELFSLYVDGKTYTNNFIVQLDKNSDGNRIPSYMITSPTVDIIDKGICVMKDGSAIVAFHNSFSAVLSDDSPVIVTVTPHAKCNGLYIEAVSKEGFTVKEIKDSTAIVKFSWIAIGTKAEYSNLTHSPELLSSDFDDVMDGVMFNDSDSTRNGTPIWWDGSNVRHDTPPASLIQRDPVYGKPSLLQTITNSQDDTVKEEPENLLKKDYSALPHTMMKARNLKTEIKNKRNP